MLCINLYKPQEPNTIEGSVGELLNEANPSIFFPHIEKYLVLVSSEGVVNITKNNNVISYQLSRLVLRKSPDRLSVKNDPEIADLVSLEDSFLSLETCRYFKRALVESLELPKIGQTKTIERNKSGVVFPDYGDSGHELVHIKRNSESRNPEVESLINIVLQKLGLNMLSTEVDFTFNRYLPDAGFMWHVDTQANGKTTCVIALSDTVIEFDKLTEKDTGKFGVLENYKPQNPYKVNLKKGSILFFSKSARYDYAHRVVPYSGKKGISFNIALGFNPDLSEHLSELSS